MGCFEHEFIGRRKPPIDDPKIELIDFLMKRNLLVLTCDSEIFRKTNNRIFRKLERQ